MDLFDYMREQNKEKESPLASRLRPTKLEEVVGQNTSSAKINCYTVPSKRISYSQLFSMDLREPEKRHWRR